MSKVWHSNFWLKVECIHKWMHPLSMAQRKPTRKYKNRRSRVWFRAQAIFFLPVATLNGQQGCHIFLGTKYQHGEKYSKWGQNLPNYRKLDQRAINNTNIFHWKGLQNSPKLGFLAWKYVWNLATLVAKFHLILWIRVPRRTRCENEWMASMSHFSSVIRQTSINFHPWKERKKHLQLSKNRKNFKSGKSCLKLHRHHLHRH
jgi:hypothetical protein